MINLVKCIDNIINKKNGLNINFLGLNCKNTTDKKFMIKAYKLYQFLKKNGIKEREIIIIQLSNEEEYLLAIWAGIIGNFILVPLPRISINESLKESLFLNVISNLKSFFLLHDFSEYEIEFLKINTYKNLNIEQFYENKNNYIFRLNENRNDEDTFLILYTSGSTNEPKGVEISYKMIISNVIEIKDKLHLDKNDKVFIWTPLTHVLGLVLLHFASTLLEIEQIIVPTNEFMSNTVNYLKEISHRKCTVTTFPPFAMSYIYELLEDQYYLSKGIDLSSIKCIITGTEYINYSILQKFMKTKFKNKINEKVIVPFYGMTEAGVIISIRDITKRLNILEIKKITEKNKFNSKFIVSCGELSKDIEIVIKNKKILTEDNIEGEILIRGIRIFKGYFGDKQRSDDEYFSTGDIGFIHNNELFITGRKKDIFIYNGNNYYLNDIEVLCTRIDNVFYNDIIAFSIFNKEGNEQLIIGLTNRVKDKNHNIEYIIKKIIFLNYKISIKDFLFLDYIPMTRSGKKQRNYIKEVYLNEKK
ncbi:hypothetical protein FDF23_12020 [Fusobacterium nucleatum]|nr:AMP-binding protein [Fusobacterium nucleatum]MBW9312308.1 hypothetical protein [Fusobacterium nucleatum]